MKHLLLTIIAAVLLVGCGPSVDIWTGAQTGNIEAVKQHLADGVDVNSKSDIGRTPLDLAIACKQPQITDLLRKHGGKTRDELKAAESIVVAVELGNIEAVKQHLNDGTEVNAKGGTGRTPLHWAAIEGHKEIAELLIAEGADVNAKDDDGYTPLDTAIRRKRPETADLLRKHGGKTGTIHVVARNGDLAGVQAHLDAGVDVNVKDKYGDTPLHEAARYGHEEIVELLIAKGADVNAKQKYGETPLHNAAHGGHKEIAELLIAKGADVNVKDKYGNTTPLDTAIKRKLTETADLLRKHGGKTGEELKAEGK